jgi:hypothetical protein
LFIHGFTGHPERTWSSKKAYPSRNVEEKVDERVDEKVDEKVDETGEPPAKIRKGNFVSKIGFTKAATASSTRDTTASSTRNTAAYSATNTRAPSTTDTVASKVYWPRDLLPSTVPHARVLTYGYDTRIRHMAGSDINKDTLRDIAWNLLVALEGARRNDPLRPILFIVHSLGGIVVKEMLRRARACQPGHAHLHRVFQSTLGIIFFGTPHAGADPRSLLHKLVVNFASAAGVKPNDSIVQTLLPASERLKELREVFGPMAQEENWAIHSFQEQFGVGYLFNDKVCYP